MAKDKDNRSITISGALHAELMAFADELQEKLGVPVSIPISIKWLLDKYRASEE